MKAYSVIIRTVRGGDKYQQLLNSIAAQTVAPEHVYIILPHGYEPPKERLGYEEFVYTDKGMWSQRIFGMEYVYSQPSHSEYLFVCDDDLKFDPDFLERLLNLAEEYSIDTLIPRKDRNIGLFMNLFGLITGDRTENKKSKFKVTIKNNGSFSVNNHLKGNVLLTQSAPFACFLMRTDITPVLKLRDEMWLDDTSYAWPDDRVFFYKSYLSGFKNYICSFPKFIHLDGKSGIQSEQRRIDNIYSQSRNIIIFWNKFIYPKANTFKKKIICKFSFGHYLFTHSLVFFAYGIWHKSIVLSYTYLKGIRDGLAYCKK